MKKILNIIMLIMCSGIFMLFALGSSDVDSSKYDTDKVYNVGDTLDCPSYDITVDNVQIKGKGTSIGGYQTISDPEWIAVTLTIKNKSSEQQTYNDASVTLTNSNGEILNHATWVYDIWGVKMLDSPELESGGTKTGYIQYKNNNDDNSKLVLNVDCDTDLLDDNITYKVNISQ